VHQLNVPAAVARAASPETLFAAVRADDSARALVTFYDDATGERMELSAASLGNWVTKTHFLLLDELGLGPGARALVDLPLHWQRLVVWLGAWSAGLEVVTGSADADVAFVTADRTGSATGVDDVFVLALAAWGRGFPPGEQPPHGAHDFVAAVRSQPDAWASVRFPGHVADPAFDGTSRDALVGAARALAADSGLTVGARVALSDRSPYADRPEAVLAVLSVAGSLVLTRSAGEQAARRDVQERVTQHL
jgi:uncharacterized protein (TIGR03089 family)